MACGTIQLTVDGRRVLGKTLAVLLTIQIVIGTSIFGCGIHFLHNLQWRLVVICNYDTYTLANCIVIIGGLIAGLSLCAAKIFYDSGKETTRERFVCFLFPLILVFIGLMLLQFSLAITCRVYHDHDVETFRTGFMDAIKSYLKTPNIKKSMDRLQFEDECCGAEGFKDWLENDWVLDKFNPLLNPNVPSFDKSVYYPWKINPISSEDNDPRQDETQNNPHSNNNLETSTIDIAKLDGFSRSPRLKRDLMDPHLWVVPWSCCSVQSPGPCIHDYVVQRYMVIDLRSKDSWNGGTLYQRGCAQLLQRRYKQNLHQTFILFCIAFIIQWIILICGRYLQTSVEGVDLYNRENKTSPGYLLPCNWCTDPSKPNLYKLKKPGRDPEQDELSEDNQLESASIKRIVRKKQGKQLKKQSHHGNKMKETFKLLQMRQKPNLYHNLMDEDDIESTFTRSAEKDTTGEKDIISDRIPKYPKKGVKERQKGIKSFANFKTLSRK